MMDERAGLIAAIRADPDDDLRHLVYADWLEETGRAPHVARAQLIRAQCELRAIPRGDGRRAERERLQAIEADLLRRYRNHWAPVIALGTSAPRIDRGLTRYRVGAGQVGALTGADRFVLRNETAVTVAWRAPERCDLARLAEAGVNEFVVGFDFSTGGELPEAAGRAMRDAVARVAAAPWAGPLTELHVAGADLGAESLALLAASPHLQPLKRLTLRVPLDGDELRLLAARPWPNLRRLVLPRGHGDPTDEQLVAVAEAHPAGVVTRAGPASALWLGEL